MRVGHLQGACSRLNEVPCSVTMPLKTSIVPFLDELSPESQRTGVVNTIVKIRTSNGTKCVGQNTDSERLFDCRVQ